MDSIAQLPALSELPGEPYDERKPLRDILTELANTDRSFHAADVVTANSFALWGIFDDVNVDDNILEAYEKAYPRLANHDSISLYDHWIEVSGRGEQNATGLINGLKGKLAEIQAVEQFEHKGFTDVAIAENPTQPVWDISATSPSGEQVLIQVKTGAAGYANEVQGLMAENVDIDFAVSSEIYEKIVENSPELADRMVDTGPDFALVEGVDDGLTTLSENLGIDVPDGVLDIVPYAAAIITGSRLIYNVIRTEQQFKAADRTTRNRIQVVQTLALMSRMGVSTVLAMVGGKGGALAGSAIPGAGTVVGSVAGAIAGAGIGMYLNRHLQPRMLGLALDITGLTRDDLFYYKNKNRVEELAESLQHTAVALENLGEEMSEFPLMLATSR